VSLIRSAQYIRVAMTGHLQDPLVHGGSAVTINRRTLHMCNHRPMYQINSHQL